MSLGLECEKQPFLLALRRWGRFARNVPSGEKRGATDVFAGYPQPSRSAGSTKQQAGKGYGKSVGLVPGGAAKQSVVCLLMVTWAQARF